MHPFEQFCQENNQSLTQLARELDVHHTTLYRIRTGRGAESTQKIMQWCKKHYIDPYDVFCRSPSH